MSRGRHESRGGERWRQSTGGRTQSAMAASVVDSEGGGKSTTSASMSAEGDCQQWGVEWQTQAGGTTARLRGVGL